MAIDVAPRPASTVMLLREAGTDADGVDPGGLEVFVLHRVPGMAFAPSVTVFPGGGVDPGDSDAVTWSGPDRAWWAHALGTDEEKASALVVAAVRELFEETGVLLADGGATEEVRLQVVDHRRSLPDVLRAQGCSLQSGLLRPWANWITPEGSTRRYDTFFFLAALPAGQHAQMLTTEAESGRWARPAGLLAEHRSGALAMMPPTVAMLMDLEQAESVQSAMDQRRRVQPLTPVVRDRPGEPAQIEVGGRFYSWPKPGE